MSLSKERITYLLEVYTVKKATAEEEHELMEWMQEAPEDSELKTYIQGLWERNQQGAVLSNVHWDAMFDRITRSNKVHAIAPEPARKRIGWLRVAAAAAVLIMIGTGTYWLLTPKTTDQPTAKTGESQIKNDVAPPAGNKATLSITGGRTIILEGAENGSLAMWGAGNASKVDDELVYEAKAATKVEWHTLSIPKGSRPMQLQLTDGSEVWLNAASSITFPNTFNGNERKVTITGEAYFEVAKAGGKKFLVEANGTTTEVLGTHFNINAYQNEPSVKVTLLEGSVNVNGMLIKPGQQATLRQVQGGKEIKAISDANVDEVMAWKNGLFEFNETDIQTIMRQIERWYDVEIVYDGMVTQHFNGTLPRQINVSKVLQLLEKTGGVRFLIENKKVTVKKR